MVDRKINAIASKESSFLLQSKMIERKNNSIINHITAIKESDYISDIH